jgi:hypothetical protein
MLRLLTLTLQQLKSVSSTQFAKLLMQYPAAKNATDWTICLSSSAPHA